MMRFSPRFLNVFFFGLPAAFFPPVSGVAEASTVSIFAINNQLPVASYQLPVASCQSAVSSFFVWRLVTGYWPLVTGHWLLHSLLLRDGALARALARARVGLGALSAHGQVAAVPHAAPAADLHQPLDVHRDFLAQV